MIQWWIWNPFALCSLICTHNGEQNKSRRSTNLLFGYSSANNTNRFWYDYRWMEMLQSDQTSQHLNSGFIKLVFNVSIWCPPPPFYYVSMITQYAWFSLVLLHCAWRLQENSTELMNLNITECPVLRQSLQSSAQEQASAFLPMCAAFPMMDTVSKVTRLNGVSHCIDSYLKVSRPIIIYWCLLQSTFCLESIVHKCLEEPVYHAHPFTHSCNGLSGKRREARNTGARRNCIESQMSLHASPIAPQRKRKRKHKTLREEKKKEKKEKEGLKSMAEILD